MTELVLCRGNRFHPVEGAIARMALRLPALPNDASLDLWNRARILPEGVVHLQSGNAACTDVLTFAAATNALARLVVDGARLPSTAAPCTPEQARVAKPANRRRCPLPQVRVVANTMFSVRWVTEDGHVMDRHTYRLAWIPIVDRWVVTVSHDVAYTHGFRDQLLAAFEHVPGIADAARQRVVQYWGSLRSEFGFPRWNACGCDGSARDAEVSAMADKVWPAPRIPAAASAQVQMSSLAEAEFA